MATETEEPLVLRTDDAGEGMDAFIEKRSPVWRGR